MSADSMIQLRRGAKILDINDVTHYYVRRDFILPATSEQPIIAAGNIRSDGRGTKFGTKPGTRTWSFTVRVRGESDGEVHSRARALQAFVAQAGDDNDQTYLDYRSDNNVPEPMWGQFGAKVSYEILHGVVELGDDYSMGTRRQRAILARLTLTIQPYAIGAAQKLFSVIGGIAEDVIGSVDGTSKGLIIPEALTTNGGNKFTNPVFGSSTWSTDWTAGASLTASQNTDKRWLIPCTVSSAKLISASASNNTYTQSLNVGNTNIHSLSCYARLLDGGVISSTQLQLYYNTALTTTFKSLGNGWYKLTAENFSGINAATATGVVVKNGYTVFVTGFQIEEKAYCTQIGWGDLMGWAWAGTAHASTSTRTAAYCKNAMSNVITSGEWSACLVVRFDVPNTFSTNLYLMDWRDGSHTTAPILFYSASDDTIKVFTGATYATSSALTFAAGTTYVIHVTLGPSGFALYINGTLHDTDSYVPAPSAYGANLFIGTSYLTGNHTQGAIRLFTTYGQALTATQVTNDYNNLLPLISDGVGIYPLPWLWTKDGDNAVDNCNDSSYDNWCAIGGVPGTAPAVTEINGLLSDPFTTIDALWLSRWDIDEWLNPVNIFADLSGTVDANSCGGQYEAASVTTSETGYTEYSITAAMKYLLRREVTIFARIADTGSGASIRSQFAYGSGARTIENDWVSIAADATFRLFKTGPMMLIDDPSISSLTARLKCKRTSGTNDLRCDYFALMPKPLVRLGLDSALSTESDFTYTYGKMRIGGKTAVDEYGSVIGDDIELIPGKFNVLLSLIHPVGSNPVITRTLTYESIVITPRYALV